MRRPVAQFALAGIVVLAVFGVAAVLVLRSLAGDEALRDARQFAELAGQGIVEPTVVPSLLDGDPAAVAAVDRVVNERVLGERVVRVKVWDADGRVVYSDEPRLVGARFPLDEAKREVLRTGSTRAELSDLSGPENRFEQGQGDLYEVYLPIRAPDGTPLLFETYQRQSAVAATGRRIWLPFAALLLGSLLLLWLVQVPLAWRLSRRLQRTQEEREALLAAGSRGVRRRAAQDRGRPPRRPRPGPRRDLVLAERGSRDPGVARDEADAPRRSGRDARRDAPPAHAARRDPPAEPARERARGGARRSPRAPARGRSRGRALGRARAELSEADERLVYRAAAEALRNVDRHARATRVSVALRTAGDAVRLEVVDDGVGFTTERRAERRDDGHVGLSLLEELAARAGADVEVRSTPGAGTTFALEVPRR